MLFTEMITFYSETHAKHVNVLVGRNARSCYVWPGGGSTCMHCCASEGLILVYGYGIGSVSGTKWSGIRLDFLCRENELCNLFGNNDRCTRMRMETSYLCVNND
jgi:hypothetical protein